MQQNYRFDYLPDTQEYPHQINQLFFFKITLVLECIVSLKGDLVSGMNEEQACVVEQIAASVALSIVFTATGFPQTTRD